MKRQGLGFAIVMLAAAAALAGTALSGTSKVTLGSSLEGTPSASLGFSCGVEDPCVLQQAKLTGQVVRAPFDGTIRKWAFKTSDSADNPYKLRVRVLRKQSRTRYHFVGRSKPGLILEKPGTYRFKTNLKIKKGDSIGLELPAQPGGVSGLYLTKVDGARTLAYFDAPKNRAASKVDSAYRGLEVLFSARIRRR